MSIEVPEHLEDNVVERAIWEKVHIDKMNQIILIDGLPRTGKSELGLRLAEDLDPTFSIDRIAWKYCDFLELSKNSESKGHQVFMWDEAGIADWGANARQFWSEGNMSASTLFQTMGFKENIAIISLPMKMMLDKHVRSLIHVNIKTLKVMPRKGMCKTKTFFIVPKDDGDSKTIFPRIKIDGCKFRIKSQYWGRASKKLRKDYKQKSEGVKQELQDKLVAEAILRSKEGAAKPYGKATFKELYDDIVGNIDEYWNKKKNKVDSGLILIKHSVGQNIARKLAALINMQYDNQELPTHTE